MSFITAEQRQAGKDGELAFQQWLDTSLVPYTYFQQGVKSFPQRLVGAIKRPDYLVGFPGIGSIAYDVKNKNFQNRAFAVSEEEVNKFGNFEWFFNIRVMYAFWSPESNFTRCALIFNAQFMLSPTTGSRYGPCKEVRPEIDDFYDVTTTPHSALP